MSNVWGAARASDSGHRAPSLQRPPHPRPRGSAPARTVSESQCGSLAAEGAPSPRLTCALDPAVVLGGAGRGRSRPADSNFVAVGTAQSSLPREAGGADRAVTQQLARWRAGPCGRPHAGPGPRAQSPQLCSSGCGEKRQPSAAPAPLWGKLAPAALFPRGSGAVRACSPAGSGGDVGVQGTRRAGVPGETHPTHKQNGGGGRRESFSVWY